MNLNRAAGTIAAVAVALGLATSAHARIDDQMLRDLRASHPEMFTQGGGNHPQQMALPDIFGPGSVLTVGNVFMKVTNIATIGNPFLNTTSDPSAQWPGASGIEYLAFMVLSVGAVNPTATDPSAQRKVSYFNEWRPPTLEPQDRMYRAYDGIIGGQRLTNDDDDVDALTGFDKIDEDFLDGRDNDGDGRIDEDYAALGQQMYSCTMRDDTQAAASTVFNEAHVPLVLEMRQLSWAYSVPGFTNFNPIEWTVYNRSGHTLDSMYFAVRVDFDAGPLNVDTFFSDDLDIPYAPQGDFDLAVTFNDPRRQRSISPITGDTDTLCPSVRLKVRGFSVADDDGDLGRTGGLPSFLLLGHTVDPLGVLAPARVGWRSYRGHIAGTPYVSGGNPTIDQQRYEFMSNHENVDPETGFITQEAGDEKGDYQFWASVGPFLDVPDGGSIQVTGAIAIDAGDYRTITQYPGDYARYAAGLMSPAELIAKYPILANAITAQVAYEGVYEQPREGFLEQVPDCHGCETCVILPEGETSPPISDGCSEASLPKPVNDRECTWFNFDCDMCSGVWDEFTSQGYYLRHWNAESPPPSPNLNVAATHNYTDNPDRVVAGGDNSVSLAWDNLSETTADPKSNAFDFRGYQVWKVANWQRPVGAAGPNDDEWQLLAQFRYFDHADDNRFWQRTSPTDSVLICPRVFVPNWRYPPDAQFPNGRIDTATVEICLNKGDFWDRQSGMILRADPTVDCLRDGAGECLTDSAFRLGTTTLVKRARYPVGRYKFVDAEVKNGFIYFYSVTASDSTGQGANLAELNGRRAAVEADAVIPQGGTKASGSVWVVPNPYRGYQLIAQRPSAWDLTPNATDPTGTHVDFMGLPSGGWQIRIYTVSGDLVAELHNDDPVNDSIRSQVTDSSGNVREGYNRQQDNANDGQARWNLISRSGQDVVSGIYVFVVKSNQGEQRGKFVVIR